MGYMTNPDWFNSLPAEYQTILEEEFAKAVDDSFEQTWQMDQDYIDANEPFIAHIPTADEMAQLKDLTAPVYEDRLPDIVKQLGKDKVQAWFDLVDCDYDLSKF